jgi:hypothetical protein
VRDALKLKQLLFLPDSLDLKIHEVLSRPKALTALPVHYCYKTAQLSHWFDVREKIDGSLSLLCC